MRRIFLLILSIIISLSVFSNNIDSLKQILNAPNSSYQEKTKACLKASRYYSDLSEDSIAIIYHNKAFVNIESVKDDSIKNILLSKTYNQVIYFFQIKHIYDSVFYYTEKYIELNIPNNFFAKIDILRLKGLTHSNIAQYAEALNEYHKVLDLLKIAKEDNLNEEKYFYFYGKILNDIGTVHSYNNAYEKAKTYINSALKVNIENDIEENNTGVYINLGLVAYRQDSVELAIYYWEYALANAKVFNQDFFISRIIVNLGSANYKLERYTKALEYYKEGTGFSLKQNDAKDIATGYNNQGYAYYQLGEYQKSIEYNLKAREIGEKHNFVMTLALTSEVLSMCYTEIGDYKNALKYYKINSEINDSVFNADNSRIINEIETKYEVYKKDKEIELLHNQEKISELNLDKSKSEKILILLIAIFILGIVFIIFYRAKLKQKNKFTQLEKQNYKVETQLLRSQMNPHFIFNSMNSIQSFISNNNFMDAERYLSKFAGLMRLILENSRKSFISIDDEVKTLNLYLQLEKLRFDNKFEFNINISDEIDSSNIHIPPMLAQPYIENAILHGIMNKSENGEINISFEKQNNIIICKIDDDGIGRRASQLLKTGTKKKHNSLGIKLTEERIDFLNKELKLDVNINIIDKVDEKNNATGTTVIVKMPFVSEF